VIAKVAGPLLSRVTRVCSNYLFNPWCCSCWQEAERNILNILY